MNDLPKAEFSPDPETERPPRGVTDPPRWLAGDRLDGRVERDDQGVVRRVAWVGPEKS